MTSYDFEVAAKNAVIDVIKEKYGEDYLLPQIHMVWFGYVLGFMKGILIDCGKNNRMFEVTYNRDRQEMYVDAYQKQSNTVVRDLCVTPKHLPF